MSSALLLTYHGEDYLPGPHGLRTLAGHHIDCPLVVPTIMRGQNTVAW
jgi:hypothetical protein